MLLKLILTLYISSFAWTLGDAVFQVGLILKRGDETTASIVEQAFKSQRTRESSRNVEIRVVKEVADEEDSVSYHRAFCRLLSSGIDAFISPAASPYYPVLNSYAREYKIPLITPYLPQEVSQFSTNYSFGIRPTTSRLLLTLFQHYGWSDVVYLYDHDDGPENLSFIFVVGRRVLNLTLYGILKVTSAKEANRYLQRLDSLFKNKLFHVVLDTDSSMARDIIWRHINDIHVRKKNFHFVLAKPALEEFWITQRAAFGAINVTAFLIKNQLPQGENVLQNEPEISQYYYYDAALVLEEAARKLAIVDYRTRGSTSPSTDPQPNCLDDSPRPRPSGMKLSKILNEVYVKGVTGQIRFEGGKRSIFDLNITEITPRDFNQIARVSRENQTLSLSYLRRRILPTALPQVLPSKRLKIVSIINAPYMMLKNTENETLLQGNDRFEGYCKDILDVLAHEMNFDYDIHLVEDNMYGIYDRPNAKWTGIIGELIQGKADIAVADLTITGQRQRVVEFTDPYDMVGFSIVMKNPRYVSKLSSISFFLSAFTLDVWICILFAALFFCVLFHFITKFTGAPDSIESASGIWGRKHAAIVNVWFAIGSSMLQGTGVYPRSISSRILSGFNWFFTLMLSSMFIASIASQILTGRLSDENNPQLSQIKSLSLESIISESNSRGWPKIGLVHPRFIANFIKKSTIPTYVEFSKYLENNPDVIAGSEDDGLKRVHESSGDYMVILDSSTAQYAIGRKPCDLIATHDSVYYASYGFATPLGSHLISDINKVLHQIQEKGILGDLHRKWWIDSGECKNVDIENRKERTTHVFSGLLCVSAIGFLIVLGVFTIQYIRRNQNKENRRQQLSFEDMNLGQPLPTPPPELLAEPPPVLNLPEYDKKTLL